MASKLIQNVVLGLSLLGAVTLVHAQPNNPSNPIYPSCLDNQRTTQDPVASGISGAAGSAANSDVSNFCSSNVFTENRGDGTFESRFRTATGCGTT